jgi:membrane protein DedA with SNARE-associated domain
MFAHELARAEPLLHEWGYAAVFAAIFAEGVGIPAPGQTLLLAGGVLAARGQLSLAALLVTAALASAGGTFAGWAIGRSGGRRLLDRFAGRRLERIESLFQRRGAGVVLLGRFVDGARQLTGLAAGAFEMPLARFLVWDVLGALLWTAFWGIGSWLFTREFHALAALAHRARVPLLVAAALLAGVVIVWIVRGGRGGGAPAATQTHGEAGSNGSGVG